jgi:hypothetical protein
LVVEMLSKLMVSTTVSPAKTTGAVIMHERSVNKLNGLANLCGIWPQGVMVIPQLSCRALQPSRNWTIEDYASAPESTCHNCAPNHCSNSFNGLS